VRAAASTDGSENILLLGSDSRTGLSDDILEGGIDERADTILVVHIPADHQNVQVMSIMRDMWVDIPGEGAGKINAALAYGGVPLVIETIEGLIDSRIDHVAIADFEGFADMSTALGGVEVQSPVAFDSGNMAGFSFTKGSNIVQGDQALAFVRERYAFATADYQRVKNQQSFLIGVMKNLTTVEGVPNIQKYNNFLIASASHLTVDEGLSFSNLVLTGYSLRDVRNSDVNFFTLPSVGTGTSEDGQSIVLIDTAALKDIAAAMKAGTLQQYLDSNDLLNGN
jgi:LCP family protein required for cell wall assembly